jgi:hypothetical protein
MMEKSALDHSCEKYGCATRFLNPKLHTFDDCFGGLIRMGDIDGAVERNGHILWMEWKRGAVIEAFDKKHMAQLRMAKAFTASVPSRHTFVFVIGCPIQMEIERFRIVRAGNWWNDWLEGDTERFKGFLRHWYSVADGKAGSP